MKIIYYKSIICPKCIPTTRLLKQIKKEYPEIEVEEIEIITNRSRAKQDDVRHIPTIIAGDRRFYKAPTMNELLAVLQPVAEPIAA
jgi:glutaredoxin